MPSAQRIAVFTTSLRDEATVEAVEALTLAFPEARLLVVGGNLRIARKRWVRNKLRRLQREPLSYPLELTGQALAKFRRRRDRTEGSHVGLPRMADLDRVEVHQFDWIHDPACLRLVAEFEPWLGISFGAPILKRKLFGIPERGTLNLHLSLLPEYRGMPAGFWELHDGTAETGASVHWMDDGLDTGEVIAQRRIEIPRYATPLGLRHLMHDVGLELLVDAVRDVLADRVSSIEQGDPKTETRSRPPMLLARRVRGRCLRRRPGARSLEARAKALAKHTILWGYVHGLARIRNRLRGSKGRCHVAVLMWHRVDDRYHDSITTGVEQFERQLRRLKRHYDVIDLGTLVAQRGEPRKRPVVVLTFDDGFRDNRIAARLLRRLGLPCTFFYATRIVGTDRAFPYDQKNGQEPSARPLSWGEVREMHRQGFRIANHTQHHTNIAEVPLAEARKEIRAASEDLRRELGDAPDGAHPERWFAYCFGGRKDITEEVRAALSELGIELCLSAYNGVNPPDWDPMDVKRQGVTADFTDLAFRALVEGWTLPDPKE